MYHGHVFLPHVGGRSYDRNALIRIITPPLFRARWRRDRRIFQVVGTRCFSNATGLTCRNLRSEVANPEIIYVVGLSKNVPDSFSTSEAAHNSSTISI